jgi:hypothetical protein
MFLEDLFDQIPAHSQEEGYVFNRGDTAQVNDITIKGLDASSLAFGKVDGLSQGPTTLTAILKMTAQHYKLRPSAYRQRSKTALKSPLHDQFIPASPTSGTGALIPFPVHVIVNGPTTILGAQVLVAHQTQSMIKIACRRHGRSPSLLFLAKSKGGYTALAMTLSNPQPLFTPAFAG